MPRWEGTATDSIPQESRSSCQALMKRISLREVGPKLQFHFLESPLGTAKENTISGRQIVPLFTFTSLKPRHSMGPSGRSSEGSGVSFSNEPRPGKRHRKFKSVGTECFALATKRIQMRVSISSCFLFIPSQETPGAKAGELCVRGGCWLSRQTCRLLTPL